MILPSNIGEFSLYTKTPNKILYGHLYLTSLEMETKNLFKRRTVRVWLPEDYDFNNPNKRYPVIYMSDGQNLVDHFTSPFGEWNIEEHIQNMQNKGFEGMIVVGIDCPEDSNDRLKELCPPYCPDKNKTGLTKKEVYGNLYGDFLFNVVKPLIDKTFYTKPDKKFTGVGGSSMGGIMSFYLGCKYYDKIGFSLCFSPAFFLYKNKTLRDGFEKNCNNHKEYGKFFFFVGGEGFEKEFVNATFLIYKLLNKKGFDKNQIALIYDSRQIHHEDSWSKYFEEALVFLTNHFKEI